MSEAAEQRLELVSYDTLVAATDNDAYNTLVATDLAPEFGRENVFQIMRAKSDNARHQLPRTLGGKKFGPDLTFADWNKLVREGWTFNITGLTDEFSLEDWRAGRPDAHLIGRIDAKGALKFVRDDGDVTSAPDVRLLALRPPEAPTKT